PHFSQIETARPGKARLEAALGGTPAYAGQAHVGSVHALATATASGHRQIAFSRQRCHGLLAPFDDRRRQCGIWSPRTEALDLSQCDVERSESRVGQL